MDCKQELGFKDIKNRIQSLGKMEIMIFSIFCMFSSICIPNEGIFQHLDNIWSNYNHKSVYMLWWNKPMYSVCFIFDFTVE